MEIEKHKKCVYCEKSAIKEHSTAALGAKN